MPTNEPPAARKMAGHPCFDADAKHTQGRAHLPVAPACNVQCNYCNRSYDCVAESRPGVTSSILQPWQAERYFDEILEADPSISVAGIAGPGDALASADATLSTLRRIHEKHPETLLCVATNGLALPQHAEALAAAGVSHITVTVNAIDPEIGKLFYAWIRDGKNIHRGRAAAELLWSRQKEGIARMAALGILVKVNTIVVPGLNDKHVGAVAEACLAAGASMHNCMAMIPVEGSEFANVSAPTAREMTLAREAASPFLPQMEHCSRCRADAVGRLGEAMSPERYATINRHARLSTSGTERKLVAVASMEGAFVNQHLGEADELLIYAVEAGAIRQVDVRRAPPTGTGNTRWEELGDLLTDCIALLVAGIGPSPSRILKSRGLRVFETEGLVTDLVPMAAAGGEIRKLGKPFRCGDGCSGKGQGCA
jgi:nitrogen fixation protein NifB